MSNPIKKLLGQTAIYGLPSIVGRLLNFIMVPLYISKFKQTSDYGVVSELYAWVAFLVVFLTFGMETAFFRFLQNKEEDRKQVFNNSFLTVLSINTVFFVLILLFSRPIADALLYSGHYEYIILLGAVICIDAISALPLAKLRSEEKALKFAGIQSTSIFVNIALNLVLMLFFFDDSDPGMGVIFIFAANLFASLVKPLFLYKDFLHIKFKFDSRLAKEMVIYALPLMIGGLAGIVNETIDRILLVHLLYDGSDASLIAAKAEVGIYSACYKLAMLVTILIQAYRFAAEPFFFSQMKNEDKNQVYTKVMNYFVAVVCLVFLVVSLNVDFIKLFFIPNEAYWIGLKVVPILLLANVFLGVYFNQSIWYKLSNQTRFGAYIAIIGALITVLINVIFIPTYGYMASAWATMTVYAIQMVLSYILGQKYYPIPYNIKKFFLYLGVAIALYFVTVFFNLEASSLAQFLVHNSIVVVYLAMIWKIEKPRLVKKGT
jgi:O-antigen/teichoic acid export membrane protein